MTARIIRAVLSTWRISQLRNYIDSIPQFADLLSQKCCSKQLKKINTDHSKQ